MDESQRIRRQLKLAYHGPAWHGPALGRILEGVAEPAASAHPLPGAHSIREIVAHIAAWMRAAAQTIERNEYVFLQGEQDWPPARDAFEASWKALLQDLERAQEQLSAAIRALPEARLEETIPGREYTFYDLLHGVVQHNLYHAGQIALLKKAAR